jgi:hypothetical protein
METETPHIAGSYRTSTREYMGHVPALNRGTRFSIGFGVLALLLAVLSLPYLVPVVIELALAIALLSGYYAVPFTWLTLRSRREQVEQSVDVFADDAGLHFTHGVTEVDVPWAEIDRLREDRDCFFVMARYSRVYILPERAFDPAGLEAFRQLAASRTRLGRG